MPSGPSFSNRIGLGNVIPGPYTETKSLYDNNRFKDRDSFVVAHSGSRVGGDMGRRGSVYANLPNRNTKHNYTNLGEQIEKEMGNCIPGRQDTAPAYGVPGPPNIHPSYPILAPFENRRKWTDGFASPFQPNNKNKQQQQGGNAQNSRGPGSNPGPGPGLAEMPTPGGELHSRHPVVPKQQPILMGCNIVSDGLDQYAHRMTYLNRWFDEDDGEIMIQTPKSMQNKQMGEYNDELFKTHIDNTENKISTGVMTNPYTGEMYEMFEDAMPPPTTDKHIPDYQFEVVNPKMLQMFGGLNPHAPLPKKKEICLDVPGSDHGNNVWGDQLYEEERRKRMVQEIGKDLWNNRTGDYSTAAAFAKEKPAGYVGVQQMYRALPYLPPVNNLDNKGYMPVTDYQAPKATVIKGEVSVRKADLTTCPFQFAAGPLNDQPEEYVVSQYNNRPTNRGSGDQYYAGVPYMENNDPTGPQQTQNKPTLKEFMEQPHSTGPQYSQVLAVGGNGYVVSQTQNKPTMKEFMENSLATGAQYNITLGSGGNSYVVSQTTNKPTMKEFMEQPLSTGAQYNQILGSGSSGYVVSQTQNKPTLKEFGEQTHSIGAQANVVLSSGGHGYVVNQTMNKPTLREMMEQPLSMGAQSNVTLATGGNSYVVSQTTNKPTLREMMEQPLSIGAQANDTLVTGGSSYVVNQTQNRPTLKQQMESEYDMGNFCDGGDNVTGSYIDFQGPMLETARAYYEKLPGVGRPAEFNNGVGGDFVGSGTVTSRQNRGTDSLNWVTLSKVPQDAEDTSSTWIGVYDRDTKRELGPYTPLSDLAPSYEAVAGHMIGSLAPRCNLDLHETDDEFTWSHGFAPQTQDIITG